MKRISSQFEQTKEQTNNNSNKPKVVIAPRLKKTREVLDRYGNIIKTIMQE
jgi:hypothetical protein